MSRELIRASRLIVASIVAVISLATPAAQPPALAGEPDVVVSATEFDPGLEPTPRDGRSGAPAGLAPRDVSYLARTGDSSSGVVTTRGSLALETLDPAVGASAITYDNAGPVDEYGPQATSAIVGAHMVVAKRGAILSYTFPGMEMTDYHPPTDGYGWGFFGIPATEWFWGPTVAGSIYRGRFIVAVPSYQGHAKDCAKGFLNVAVSKTSNPDGRWLQFRIPMNDAWTDSIAIGMSDDKVVLSTNEFDLRPASADCLGSAWEGARLRVMDWSDLLDGGSVTVRDVSPTPRTSYWSWVPVAATPGTSSKATGSTIRLVGDRKATSWGHLAYATIKGSAKAGTARLVGNVDLTAKRSVRALVGPPATILAMAEGNGWLDERVLSATSRGSRLYLTTHDQCKTAEDTDYRSCARVIELDTSTTTPTVIEDIHYVEPEQDTFLPFVGTARDGTVFVEMSRSSAVDPLPTDHYVAYHGPGGTFLADGPEVLFLQGTERPTASTGSSGSFVPDPYNPHRAWAQVAASRTTVQSSVLTGFIGNLSADPGGSVVVGRGTGWANSYSVEVALEPLSSSPITWVRWSASPDTTDTPGGPMLTHAAQRESVPWIADTFSDAALGGTTSSPFTVYVQWQTGDGRWSPPVATPIQIDTKRPVVQAPTARFATGKVTLTVPLQVEWPAATDDDAGVATIEIRRQDDSSAAVRNVPGDATSCVIPAHAGKSTTLRLSAFDRAGNQASVITPSFTIRAIEDTSSAVKYSSGWTTTQDRKASRSTLHYATRAGKKATYSFTGRAVGFVTTMGPNRGKAEIWVDGVLATTLDLYRSSSSYRRLVWQTSWDAPGLHTVVVKVLGTNHRPRVDIDQFVRI